MRCHQTILSSKSRGSHRLSEAEYNYAEHLGKSLNYLFDRLDISRLLRYTIAKNSTSSGFWDALMLFLEENGQTSSFLHLGGIDLDASKSYCMQLHLDKCPVLERLRLPDDNSSSSTIHHPSVKWVDFDATDSENAEEWTLPSAQAAFPQLQGMEKIIGITATEWCESPSIDPMIPQEFVLSESDVYEVSFTGISFRNESGVVHIDTNTWMELRPEFKELWAGDSEDDDS